MHRHSPLPLSSILLALLALLALACAGCGGTSAEGGSDGTANLSLTSAEVDFTPGLPVKGTAVTVTATISNTGDADAKATTYAYTFDGNVVSAELPAIAAGESTTVSFSVTSAVADDLVVKVAADPSDKVDESSESDNTASVTITWTDSTERNVIVSGASVGDTAATSAESVTLDFSLAYYDTHLDGSTPVQWRLERTRGDTTQVSNHATTITIDAAAQAVPTVTLTWPGSAGTYSYVLTADPDDDLAESLESDNVFEFTIIWTSAG